MKAHSLSYKIVCSILNRSKIGEVTGNWIVAGIAKNGKWCNVWMALTRKPYSVWSSNGACKVHMTTSTSYKPSFIQFWEGHVKTLVELLWFGITPNHLTPLVIPCSCINSQHMAFMVMSLNGSWTISLVVLSGYVSTRPTQAGQPSLEVSLKVQSWTPCFSSLCQWLTRHSHRVHH